MKKGKDFHKRVYRWDTRHYNEIFKEGLKARPTGHTSNYTYYNLKDFVDCGCPPPNIPSSKHAFVLITSNGSWTPTSLSVILPAGSQVEYYRYEIFAVNGILVHHIIRGYASKKELCFH